MADYCDSHKIDSFGYKFKLAINHMKEKDKFEKKQKQI